MKPMWVVALINIANSGTDCKFSCAVQQRLSERITPTNLKGKHCTDHKQYHDDQDTLSGV
jgi:hypothetical protein